METTSPSRPELGSRPAGMTSVPGGTFAMGSEDFYPEEAPVREAEVDGFWMDTHRSRSSSSAAS